MAAEREEQSTKTYLASPERASAEDVHAAGAELMKDRLAVALLDAVPDAVMVMNPQRQIVAVNRQLLVSLGMDDPEQILGRRMGELVGCVHAQDTPGGCGTGPACMVCGAANAMLQCLMRKESIVSECRVRTYREEEGGAMDFEVHAEPLQVGQWDLVVLSLRDISAAKRRGVLERVFFHDVLNMASGLQAVVELMSYDTDDPQAEEEYKQDLKRITTQITDELVVQRQLLAAERGELKLNLAPVSAVEAVESVAELYRHHSVARDRSLTVGPCPLAVIETDPTLLRRVLGNLVKNALEATAKNGTVTIDAEDLDGVVAFHVTNAEVMPDDIQKQIFQRSFSTKGQSGRGIGTHSVKLLVERYLGGQVEFVSAEPEGTVFTVTLPRERRAA